MLTAVLSTLSCNKANSPGEYNFNSDFEPDIIFSETRVAATKKQDITDIDADIILRINDSSADVVSTQQESETFEIALTSSTTSGVSICGVHYLAAVLAEGDEVLLQNAISTKGGKWVLYINGTFTSPVLIDCIEGFMGNNSTYQGPRLYMHTDLYSKIGSFAKDDSSTLTFTIKGKRND
jgi:hypothetical protein